MPKLIKDAQVIDDIWRLLEATDNPEATECPDGNIIVPLNVWNAQKPQLSERQTEVGVWLAPDEFAETLAADTATLPLIALRFSGFMDGRAFSTARLLRERYNFEGELRASGSIIRDQLCYLKRCGVNAFSFADDTVDLNVSLASLNDFSDGYQTSADQKAPLFRRRA